MVGFTTKNLETISVILPKFTEIHLEIFMKIPSTEVIISRTLQFREFG